MEMLLLRFSSGNSKHSFNILAIYILKNMNSLNIMLLFLISFLQAHPEYQKKFSLFANIPKSELMTNGNFLGQAYTIMAGLNEVIEALGSKDNLAKEINHLGWTHFNRGVSVAMFEVFSFFYSE